MSDSKDNESKADVKEEIDGLDNLKEKLVHLEGVRAKQTTVKTIGLLSIVALFLYICLSLYSSYKNFDQEEFSEQMTKEIEEVFKPRLDYLSQKSEKELIPLIRDSVTEIVNKKLPEIEKRVHQIGDKVQDSMKNRLASSLESLLKEIENDLKAEIGDETFALVLDNEEFEHMVAEELYKQIEGSEEIVEDFRAEIEYLKNENPEVMKVPAEKAEKIFLTSLLDLMKYDIDPQMGEKAAVGVE